jgi:C_GCAxxG_C_C family probable redox protein
LSFKEDLGYEDPLIPQLATGLGAGIGRKGSLCGNVTGSMMVIGMRMGRKDPQDLPSRDKTYKACYEFWHRFEKEFGSCICYDLIQCHLDNAEERKKWLEAGGMEKCTGFVEKTAQMLFDFLKEDK